MKKSTRSTTSPTIYRSKLRSYESRSSASRNVSNFESDSNSEDDLSGSFNYKSPIRISSKQISKVGELLGHGSGPSGKGRTSPVKLSITTTMNVSTTEPNNTQKSLTPPTERSSQANVHNSFKSSNSVIVNVLDNSPITSINTNNVFNEPTSPVMITKCNNNNNKKIRNSRILFSSKSNQRSNNRDRNHNPDSLNDTCDLLDDICQDFNLTSFNTPNKLASQSKLGSSTPITIRYQSPLKIRRDNFIKRKHHTPLRFCFYHLKCISIFGRSIPMIYR